jgi:hypothetical protein
MTDTHCREVLNHFLAQIMINAVNLLFFKESSQLLVEGVRRCKIVPARTPTAGQGPSPAVGTGSATVARSPAAACGMVATALVVGMCAHPNGFSTMTRVQPVGAMAEALMDVQDGPKTVE